MLRNGNISISVVIPTFNRAPIIAETLERILCQTRKAEEIIVVNDGSTDNTLSVLGQYGERIKIISIVNSGDMVARNTGLRTAKGDLIAFCDDDDLWEDHFISSMSKFWENYSKPICAFSNFREVVNGQWSNHSKFETSPTQYWTKLDLIDGDYAQFCKPIIRELINFQPFFPSCMMVDRERFIKIGGWDEGVSRMVGCDFATALRIAEHPPIGVLRRPLVGIRKHGGNISGDVQRMNLGDADVLTHVLSTRPSLAEYANEIKRSIEVRRLAAFDTAFARGDFAAAERIMAMLSDRPNNLRHNIKRIITKSPAYLRNPAWRILSRR